MRTIWAVLTEDSEYEVFETKKEAEKYQDKELGDSESEYSQVVESVIMKKTDLRNSQKDLLEILKSKISYRMNGVQLAKACGVSQSYMSEVLAGKKQMSEKIINYLGYRTVIIKD